MILRPRLASRKSYAALFSSSNKQVAAQSSSSMVLRPRDAYRSRSSPVVKRRVRNKPSPQKVLEQGYLLRSKLSTFKLTRKQLEAILLPKLIETTSTPKKVALSLPRVPVKPASSEQVVDDPTTAQHDSMETQQVVAKEPAAAQQQQHVETQEQPAAVPATPVKSSMDANSERNARRRLLRLRRPLRSFLFVWSRKHPTFRASKKSDFYKSAVNTITS